ncbi:MAG TPA: GNAT family N-acetyltransferase [Streptosporangiaceae bacterium]|nr:GNAT family N-acetyltransferase [Streptosporangiaceae bacterium]
MTLIPASEVPAAQLQAFFARLPDGEQAFLKEDVRDPDTIAAWYRAGRARREAAVDGTGTLVGVVSVTPELGWSDHVGQLALIVDPAHRGQGIGRELAQAALMQALELGLSKITVEVVADQEPAVGMFRSLGFDPEALLRAHVRDRNGAFHDLIILAHSVEDNWQAFGTAGVLDELG